MCTLSKLAKSTHLFKSFVLLSLILSLSTSAAWAQTPQQYFEKFVGNRLKKPALLQPYHQAALTTGKQAFKHGVLRELPIIPRFKSINVLLTLQSRSLWRGMKSLWGKLRGKEPTFRRSVIKITKDNVLSANTVKNDIRSLIQAQSAAVRAFHQESDKHSDQAFAYYFFAERAHTALKELVTVLPDVHKILSEYHRNPEKTEELGIEMKTMLQIASDESPIKNAAAEINMEKFGDLYENWQFDNVYKIETHLHRQYVNGEQVGDLMKMGINVGFLAAVAGATAGIAAPVSIAAMTIQGSKTLAKIMGREALIRKQESVLGDPTLSDDEREIQMELWRTRHGRYEKFRHAFFNLALCGVGGAGMGTAAAAMASEVNAVSGLMGVVSMASRGGVIITDGGTVVQRVNSDISEFLDDHVLTVVHFHSEPHVIVTETAQSLGQ